MNLFFDTFPTRFGDFSIAVNEAGDLAATAFGSRHKLRSRLGDCHLIRDNRSGLAVRRQVIAYCEGELREFDLVLAPEGTLFQQRVWSALRGIPLGETRSYGQIAAALGNPRASRAVGRANATNPICLVIPCHRVIGADGSLTGFAFGEDVKRRLLAHERGLSAGRASPQRSLAAV
jgi:methylated-DNA-[protein]-cysteine S-methyltransferase